MAFRRLAKGDPALSVGGVFNPMGHVVVAFESDERASEAAQALRDEGFEPEDILQYSADEEAHEMTRMLDGATGTAGFGHEIGLMRQYKALAEQGCGWLLVFAPEEAQCEKVVEVAKRYGAKLAEKYHRLVIEDLL
jgi:hypothetical protein